MLRIEEAFEYYRCWPGRYRVFSGLHCVNIQVTSSEKVNEEDGLPFPHADNGSGIIFVSTSVNPALVNMLRSLVPIRRSFRSSCARMYCVLHRLKACSSVIEPLSDWTLKYISII